MILQNRRQYNFTRKQIARLERTIAAATKAKDEMDPLVYEAAVNGYRSLIAELRKQLREYDSLGRVKALRLDSLRELPRLLVQARVARRLTQAQLAEMLGIHAQQIQRYEETGYRSASLKRVLEVMGTLGIDLKARVPLSPYPNPREPVPTSARRAADLAPTLDLTPAHR